MQDLVVELKASEEWWSCTGLVGAVTSGRERRKLSHTYQITKTADFGSDKADSARPKLQIKEHPRHQGHEGEGKRIRRENTFE